MTDDLSTMMAVNTWKTYKLIDGRNQNTSIPSYRLRKIKAKMLSITLGEGRIYKNEYLHQRVSLYLSEK